MIEFPKNKQFKNKIRKEKLQVAIKMLEYFSGEGKDFHIIVDRESALTLFDETTEQKLRQYLILTTTDFEDSKNFKINNTNSDLYIIQGNEFD